MSYNSTSSLPRDQRKFFADVFKSKEKIVTFFINSAASKYEIFVLSDQPAQPFVEQLHSHNPRSCRTCTELGSCSANRIPRTKQRNVWYQV